MILQAWHSLSDPKMEEALQVRLDFMWFTDFDVSESVPEKVNGEAREATLGYETRIFRFRNRLVKQGLDAILFTELNRQLAANNIMVEAAQAAIVDASIIESAAKPKQTIESTPEDRKEDETEAVEVKNSADPDAAWLKKGRKSTYGYKLFAVVDENSFVRHMEITPANQSEVTYFEPLIDGMPKQQGMRVYSGKGNASKANRDMLKKRGLKDGIMHKAACNKPLTAHQKKKNKLISKIRYIVEQDFGILKNHFGFSCASYFGVDKVQAQGLRKMMCLNLQEGCQHD